MERIYKSADHCSDLEDVRIAIDAIDENIIKLLGERLSFVKVAAEFKPNLEAIPAPDRVARMIPQRQLWASEHELDPGFIGPLFAQIIHWNIHQQIQHWKKSNKI